MAATRLLGLSLSWNFHPIMELVWQQLKPSVISSGESFHHAGGERPFRPHSHTAELKTEKFSHLGRQFSPEAEVGLQSSSFSCPHLPSTAEHSAPEARRGRGQHSSNTTDSWCSHRNGDLLEEVILCACPLNSLQRVPMGVLFNKPDCLSCFPGEETRCPAHCQSRSGSPKPR